MVIKLLKHELIRIARIAVIPAVIMLVLAVLFRISIINYNGEIALPVILGVFYVFSMVATLAVCVCVGVVRFYRTLFTSEGYMTLSLPVTANQLIVSKLLASIIALVCGFVICVLSALILLLLQPGGVMQEILYILESIDLDSITIHPDGLYVIENIIDAIVSIPLTFLLFYLVMALAQLFTVKNRTLIAVMLYVGGAFVWSLFSSMVVEELLWAAAEISIHLKIWIEIVFTFVVDVVCYCVVSYIIKNKVNLIA